MPRIVFVLHDGREVPVDAAAGRSLMQVAVQHGVEGMLAECGGACACATCHVYLDGWDIGAPGPMELEILQFIAAPRRPGSRLACQVQVTDQMDSLSVQLPATQH